NIFFYSTSQSAYSVQSCPGWNTIRSCCHFIGTITCPSIPSTDRHAAASQNRSSGMNAASKHLEPAPSTMAQADFVRRFGTIYEHSPWVAERAWQNGLTAGQDNVAGLAAAMAEQVDSAPEAQQMELIRAHPRSEEHTSELQSRFDLVCRLLL